MCMSVPVHTEAFAYIHDCWQTVAITCLFVAAKIEDGRKRFCDTVVTAFFVWRNTKAKKGSNVGATCLLSRKGLQTIHLVFHLR